MTAVKIPQTSRHLSSGDEEWTFIYLFFFVLFFPQGGFSKCCGCVWKSFVYIDHLQVTVVDLQLFFFWLDFHSAALAGFFSPQGEFEFNK